MIFFFQLLSNLQSKINRFYYINRIIVGLIVNLGPKMKK